MEHKARIIICHWKTSINPEFYTSAHSKFLVVDISPEKLFLAYIIKKMFCSCPEDYPTGNRQSQWAKDAAGIKIKMQEVSNAIKTNERGRRESYQIIKALLQRMEFYKVYTTRNSSNQNDSPPPPNARLW